MAPHTQVFVNKRERGDKRKRKDKITPRFWAQVIISMELPWNEILCQCIGHIEDEQDTVALRTQSRQEDGREAGY